MEEVDGRDASRAAGQKGARSAQAESALYVRLPITPMHYANIPSAKFFEKWAQKRETKRALRLAA